MSNEIKFRNIQIVLFFKNEVDYNTLELANDISEKLPQLGKPNIFNLPDNVPNEIRIQTPKILFNNSNELNVSISTLNANLSTVMENTSEELQEKIKFLYDALLKQNVQIKSIGLVFDFICFDVDFDKIKEKYYKNELRNSELVNSSWYNKDGNLNIWKFLNVKEEKSNKVLNIRCDINNRGNKTDLGGFDIDNIIEQAKHISEEFKEKIEGELK